MAIWFHSTVNVDQIKEFGIGTMVEHLGIEFTEIGENYVRASMPVDRRTVQTYGILHGGASLVLAETLGSIGSALVIDRDKYYCVGLEINANHIRSVSGGSVIGTAIPIHLGNLTHVWDIKIMNEEAKLVCICRLTVAIIRKDAGKSFPGVAGSGKYVKD
ncbi:MAG TPA: hotdog fold thioesterase [Puia sp.]|nr:hotdog fold thioesterase [Puia sp.]